MANETMIPALPCRSIKETLEFYVAMGFEITYQQERPNTYACVKHGSIDIHFFTLKDYDPAQSYSTCLVITDDADGLHQAFAASLRQHYGKLPVAGIPRITKPNNNNSAGDRRFNVIDPGGNWVRFIQQVEKRESPEKPEATLTTKLARAFHAAELQAEHGDHEAAAKMLDKALAHDEPAPATQRVQALVLRATIAVTLGDQALAQQILADVRQMALEEDERAALVDEFERVEDLEKMLQ